jgi:hypothetical protein
LWQWDARRPGRIRDALDGCIIRAKSASNAEEVTTVAGWVGLSDIDTRAAPFLRPFVAVVSLACTVCLCAGGCCNAVCAPEFRVAAPLPIAWSSLSGASVTFCRNDACSTGTIEFPDLGFGDVTIALEGEVPGTAQVASIDVGTTSVTISLNIGPGWTGDSDTYSATIVDAQGTAVLNATGLVQYKRLDSCGTQCEQFTTVLYPSGP